MKLVAGRIGGEAGDVFVGPGRKRICPFVQLITAMTCILKFTAILFTGAENITFRM